MQTVFKIDMPKRPDLGEEKPFIPRRVHQKSRRGCLACKRRRIKCSEEKPICSKCTKTNWECVYLPSTGTTPKTLFVDERSAESPLPDMTVNSMSVNLLETDLNGLLSLTSGLDIKSVPSSSVRIIQHFQAFTSLTLGGERCRAVFHSFVVQKAWQHAYLMHMVLAISAAHLKRLHVDACQLRLHQLYSIAEAANWQTGLQLYQTELRGTSNPDFDATIATTMLTIMFTFSLDDNIPHDAYTGVDEEKLWHAINPIAATGGFRALRDIFGEFMNASVWKLVLQGSDDDSGTFSNGEQPGIEGLPVAFVDLCNLNATSTKENNEYHYIVRLLTPLLQLEPDVENFVKLMSFAGRTWRYLRPLLHKRDSIALLLVSYWFAMLRQVDQWWLTQRAKTECMALVTYLSQIQDPKIDALLSYPASFGQADLSYLWDPPDFEIDTAAIYERYFQKAIGRTSPRLNDSLCYPDLKPTSWVPRS